MSAFNRIASILLILIMSFCSSAIANEQSDYASAYATDGKKKIYFSYPETCKMINDGSCGTLIYQTDTDYVSVCVPKHNVSGIAYLHENIGDSDKIDVLSDDIHVFATHGDENHMMPTLDVVSVGVNLTDEGGLVFTAYSEYGTTEVYGLLIEIIGSVIDTSLLEHWLSTEWLPYITE